MLGTPFPRQLVAQRGLEPPSERVMSPGWLHFQSPRNILLVHIFSQVTHPQVGFLIPLYLDAYEHFIFIVFI